MPSSLWFGVTHATIHVTLCHVADCATLCTLTTSVSLLGSVVIAMISHTTFEIQKMCSSK